MMLKVRLKGFNSTAMSMNCKNSKKVPVNARRIPLKAMTGHLEIFILGEWRVMKSTQTIHVQKTCLKIRAKLATGYASLCAKLEDRMDKNTLHVAFTCC